MISFRLHSRMSACFRSQPNSSLRRCKSVDSRTAICNKAKAFALCGKLCAEVFVKLTGVRSARDLLITVRTAVTSDTARSSWASVMPVSCVQKRGSVDTY